MLKKILTAGLFLISFNYVQAANYVIDTKDAHAFINFKISHLGYSYVLGSFKTFEGRFEFDENDLTKANFSAKIDVNSLFTNHQIRDQHLTGKEFLNAKEHQFATFNSTKIESTGKNTFKLHGNLTLMGVTKKIVIDSIFIGAGSDPWGGYRAGFEGFTSLNRQDFGKQTDLGQLSNQVELHIVIEGIRQ